VVLRQPTGSGGCDPTSFRTQSLTTLLGFHTFRHSLATCMMDEQENPAVVQAIMRHSKMDMTLYYSHSRRSAKRAAQEKVFRRLVTPAVAREVRVRMRVPETIQ